MSRSSCPLSGFEEFWPMYVYSHRNSINRLLHMLGTLSIIPVALIASHTSWWLLVLLPGVAYSFAWIGHIFFERNRPATFDYPIWSVRGDFRMCALMLLGRMGGELAKYSEKPKPTASS